MPGQNTLFHGAPEGLRAGLLLWFAISACRALTGQPAAITPPPDTPTILASASPIPAETASVVPSPQVQPHTPEPTSTPAPLPEGAISPENAYRVVNVARLEIDGLGQIAWSPRGDQLAAITSAGIRIYDPDTLREIRFLASEVSPRSLAYSPSGTSIVSGGKDIPQSPNDTVRIWDARDGAPVLTLVGHREWVNAVAFSPLGDIVASGSDDGTIKIWRVSDGALLNTLDSAMGPVTDLAFSSDGKLIISASGELWRVQDGLRLSTLEGLSGAAGLALSPDGSLLAAGAHDHSLLLRRTEDWTPLRTLAGHRDTIMSSAFSPDGELIATGSRDQTVRLWRAADGQELHVLGGHPGNVLNVAFSPNGRTLAATFSLTPASGSAMLGLWRVSPSPTESPGTDPLAAPIPRLVAGQPVQITEVKMFGRLEDPSGDKAAGWAIGGLGGNQDHILRTEDGGLTWQDVTPPEPAPADNAPAKMAIGSFLDPDHAWMAYIGSSGIVPSENFILSVWKTEDGGTSWEVRHLVDSGIIFDQPPEMHFINPQTGWIMARFFVGLGHKGYVLVRTLDGGESWEQVNWPPHSISTCEKTALAFADGRVGWLANECPFELAGGVFVDSTDTGGVTWEHQPLPPPIQDPSLFASSLICRTKSPHLFTARSGVLLLTCVTDAQTTENTTNYLYRTDDGGDTWIAYPSPGGSLAFVSASVGWALSREIHMTTDGGQSWVKVKSVNWDGQFSFINEAVGWAAAHSDQAIALVKTTDGGGTWSQLDPVIGP